ncbi:hypothetical protein Tco_0591436 [Tanacetum coccineum]
MRTSLNHDKEIGISSERQKPRTVLRASRGLYGALSAWQEEEQRMMLLVESRSITLLPSNSTPKHKKHIEMVGGAEIPQTRTSSGVRSTEEMDIAINDLNSKFASMSTVLEEIRSAIVGGGSHPNREGNEHGIHRSRTNFEGFMLIMGVTILQNKLGDMMTSCLHDDIMSSDDPR